MKNLSWLVVVSVLFFFGGSTSGMAGHEDKKEEQRLEAKARALDAEASQSEGRVKVVGHLTEEFNVDEARINSLRDKNLGYGEISNTLSLAQQMPGGINDANVQKVLELRQGEHKTGWGKVANDLDVRLGPTVSQVQKSDKVEVAHGKSEGRGKKK